MEFKHNLRKQRNLADLSQEGLADKMSVSRQTISKWENGDTFPSTMHIFMLAKILDCDINVLLGNDKVFSGDLNKLDDHARPLSRKFIYQTAGIFAILFIMLIGFETFSVKSSPSINDSKVAVFEKILDGSLNDVMSHFVSDGYTENKIVGYGVTKNNKTFYIKCNLYNGISNQSCAAIIYFCRDKNNYSYDCQYLDDPDYIPNGEYYEIG